MRTNLTQDQVTAIIHDFFASQDGSVNFLYYDVGDDGSFNGCLVDHVYSVELLDTVE